MDNYERLQKKGIGMACGNLSADSYRESYPRAAKSPAGWRRRKTTKSVKNALKSEGTKPEKAVAGGDVWWQGGIDGP